MKPLAWEGRWGKCRMAYAQRETCPCMYAVLPAGVLTTYPYVFLHPCSNFVESHSGSFSNKADASAKTSPNRNPDRGDSVSIIFVTGNPDFALEGYDLEAVSYIVKPVKRQRLWAALDRARERIAHRASIIVGRIVERGSHEELLARQGQYAGMWHAQAKYYVEQEPGVPVNSF